ncbi:MAG: hypothetical protein Kow0062_19650 [Acidobacteriota bacterium]
MRAATTSFGCLALAGGLLLGAAAPARASIVDWLATDEGALELGHTRIIGQKSFRLGRDEVIRGDVYVSAAEGAVINGSVEGDLFVATLGTVDFEGRVAEDFSIASLGTADLHGSVGDDLRVATVGTAVIDVVVAGDVLVSARDVRVLPGSAVDGALVVWGTTVSIEGRVSGPVRVTAGRVVLRGTIDDDVTVRCDELVVEPEARIGGDLVYDARNDVAPGPGVVDGEVTRAVLGRDRSRDALAEFEFPKLGVMFDAYLAAVALIAGTIFLLVFGPLADHALDQASSAAGLLASFGIGLVALLVMFVLGIVCVFALPFALAVWSALGALVYFGGLLGKILFGCLALQPILRRRCHPLLALVVGVTLTFLVCLIPVLGDLAWIVITLTGMGATLMALRQGRPAAAGDAAAGPPMPAPTAGIGP